MNIWMLIHRHSITTAPLESDPVACLPFHSARRPSFHADAPQEACRIGDQTYLVATTATIQYLADALAQTSGLPLLWRWLHISCTRSRHQHLSQHGTQCGASSNHLDSSARLTPPLPPVSSALGPLTRVRVAKAP